ncbi:MAG: 16S rRNA (adenine(1518)-N(6)/adenine(1519)-N(6))-dimethyltransferase RsmA [bacterium]
MHRAKKSLGQNFLRSGAVLRSIVDAGAIVSSDIILEIGPGKGALTEALLETGAKVIAIEKDRELIPYLQEKFSQKISEGKLELIEKDVLEFEPKDVGFVSGGYKIIANIPYYITGAILEKFMEGDILPERIVFLVQKEVADRIVARDKKESILSISVKAFGVPKNMVKVSKKAFTPQPKVDSAVLLIDKISHEYFKTWNIPVHQAIREFFDIIHVGFAHKRKLLARNLEKTSSKEIILNSFTECNLSVSARAEDISPTQWLALAKLLAQK